METFGPAETCGDVNACLYLCRYTLTYERFFHDVWSVMTVMVLNSNTSVVV